MKNCTCSSLSDWVRTILCRSDPISSVTRYLQNGQGRKEEEEPMKGEKEAKCSGLKRWEGVKGRRGSKGGKMGQ